MSLWFFFALGLAIVLAQYLLLCVLYGVRRVQTDALEFVETPKGRPWVVSNGDLVEKDIIPLHFVMTAALWFGFSFAGASLIQRVLPKRNVTTPSSPNVRLPASHPTHSRQEVDDGTWTVRASRLKSGGWRAIIQREWLQAARFRRARIDLEDGPVILIGADEMRGAFQSWLDDPTGQSFKRAHIDLQKSTLDGAWVKIQHEVPNAPR